MGRRGSEMWKATDINGVFMAPILAYMLVALVIYMLLRPILVRLHFARWSWHTPLAETGLYVCILSLLVMLF
jgi:hypothetical protein